MSSRILILNTVCTISLTNKSCIRRSDIAARLAMLHGAAQRDTLRASLMRLPCGEIPVSPKAKIDSSEKPD